MLQFDWDRFSIGSAHYPEGPTGCTVFSFPNSLVNIVADYRGGACGSIFSDNLNQGLSKIDAVVLAGGSLLGLEAATGVTSEIFKKRQSKCRWDTVPLVTGAVIYDWLNRKGGLYPDKELGRAAYRAAEPGKFLLGPYGAGANAYANKILANTGILSSGQGGAFETFDSTKIAAFTVVNSLGVIHDEQGKALKELPGQNLKEQSNKKHSERGNTTLTVVITNINFTLYQLQQIARQVQNSISEVIRPYGTFLDGDILYCISTREQNVPNRKQFYLIDFGMQASQVVKKAIYSIFPSTKERIG